MTELMYELICDLLLGSKETSVIVVYTPFKNLKKTGSMDVGQVGFHDSKQVGRLHLYRHG